MHYVEQHKKKFPENSNVTTKYIRHNLPLSVGLSEYTLVTWELYYIPLFMFSNHIAENTNNVFHNNNYVFWGTTY